MSTLATTLIKGEHEADATDTFSNSPPLWAGMTAASQSVPLPNLLYSSSVSCEAEAILQVASIALETSRKAL